MKGWTKQDLNPRASLLYKLRHLWFRKQTNLNRVVGLPEKALIPSNLIIDEANKHEVLLYLSRRWRGRYRQTIHPRHLEPTSKPSNTRWHSNSNTSSSWGIIIFVKLVYPNRIVLKIDEIGFGIGRFTELKANRTELVWKSIRSTGLVPNRPIYVKKLVRLVDLCKKIDRFFTQMFFTLRYGESVDLKKHRNFIVCLVFS